MIGHRVLRHQDPLLEILFGKEKKTVPANRDWTPVPEPLPGPQLVFDAGLALPLPSVIKTGLKEVQKKESLGRWTEGGAIFLTAALTLLMGQIFLDLLFEIPWLARVGFLIGDVFALRFLWKKVQENFWGPPWSDEAAALRVEKHFGFIEGALIGAVELADGKPGTTQGSAGLLQGLINEAGDKVTGLNMSEAVSATRAWQWAGTALGFLAFAVFLTIQTLPSSGILIQRLLLLNPAPLSGTQVSQVTEDFVLQEGGPATLTAKALGAIPLSGHVQLVYPDGRREDVPVTALASTPDLFSVTIPGVREPFRYRFFLHDAEGLEYAVKMESPPAIQSLKRETKESKGKPTEEAAVSGRINWEEGGSLRLVATATGPLKSATLNLETKGRKIAMPMQIEGFGRKVARVEIPETQGATEKFSIELLGENNVKSVDPVVYSLERVPAPKTAEEGDSSKSANPAVSGGQGMRAKDRAALITLQSEPVPDEYTAMVRQYLKNITGETN